MKYEILPSPKQLCGVTVYQIRALRNIPRHGVKKGDLGGYIQSKHNLSQNGDCWVADEAVVIKDATVKDNALLAGEVIVTNNARIYDNAKLFDYVTVFDDAQISGNAELFGEVIFHSDDEIS